MANVWFVSDTHFGHANFLTFRDVAGLPIRTFSTVEQMDETMVARWNSVVGQYDRVYHLGDVAMRKASLSTLGRLKGKKVLLKGNHDIFKLPDYAEYFEDIRAYKVYPEHGLLLSHVPVHPAQLGGRFKTNVHGHLHSNEVGDPNYINICVEKTDYTPISLDEILSRRGASGDAEK